MWGAMSLPTSWVMRLAWGITMIRRRSCVAGPMPPGGVSVKRGQIFPAEGGGQGPAVTPLSPDLDADAMTSAVEMGAVALRPEAKSL